MIYSFTTPRVQKNSNKYELNSNNTPRDRTVSRDWSTWITWYLNVVISRDINAKLTSENVLLALMKRHVKIKFHLSLFDLYCRTFCFYPSHNFLDKKYFFCFWNHKIITIELNIKRYDFINLNNVFTLKFYKFAGSACGLVGLYRA